MTRWALLCREYSVFSVFTPLFADAGLRAYLRSSHRLAGDRCIARGVLGGQVRINDVPSGDDLVQFRGDRATPSAAASLSQDLLGVLRVPAGATPWSTNTNALMSLVSFVQSTYFNYAWTEEEALDTRRGFVAAVVRGWTNADGSRQLIRLARFATPAGAASAFDEVSSGWKQQHKSIITTVDLYGHLVPEASGRARDALDRAFSR
jgi:hypothetical protein